ncbi:MAG: acyl-CoA dehydrogenase N-terminal domain-containing protein, partial [Achromobacter spanius]
MPYVTPLQDFRFTLKELAGLDDILKLPGFDDVTPDLVDAILEENGRFVEQAVAPLNVPGDTHPPVWNDGQVTTTPGYAQGFKDYAAGGWQGLQHPQAWGGQGLPKLVAAAPAENIQAASLAFSLCPMLTDGVIEAVLTVGSDAQRKE